MRNKQTKNKQKQRHTDSLTKEIKTDRQRQTKKANRQRKRKKDTELQTKRQTERKEVMTGARKTQTGITDRKKKIEKKANRQKEREEERQKDRQKERKRQIRHKRKKGPYAAEVLRIPGWLGSWGQQSSGSAMMLHNGVADIRTHNTHLTIIQNCDACVSRVRGLD